LDQEILDRIDAFVKRTPGTTRPAVMKAAIELGLAELEARHAPPKKR
jgi:hypothetical protein